MDRLKAKNLGKLATRLYVILLLICFIVLGLYNVSQPQTVTITFVKPSLNTYNNLILDHNDTLQCPCSSISSMYTHFINIQPIFHQVCSSPFVSDEWRTNTTSSLVPDLTLYDIRDYRRFISSHLHFLSGLCQLSMTSVNNSVNQFLSSLFVTDELLAQAAFDAQINLLIDQSDSTVSQTFTRLLDLLRATNHGNAIITTYSTNFHYIVSEYNADYSAAITKAMTYDDGCSCALEKNCTTQASFVNLQSSENRPIKGLKMGCTPSESFLSSTLECFYDISCINLIQEQMSNGNTMNAVDAPVLVCTNASRFSINTIISELVQELFTEKWSRSINYSAYFDQCSPALCSYTYIQQLNPLYTVTVSLGLFGGLNFVLKWICPNIIYLIAKIYWYRKQRRSTVEPTSDIEMATVQTINTILNPINDIDITVEPESIPRVTTPLNKISSTFIRCFLFGIVLLIMMVVAFIVTFVYFERERYYYPTSTMTSTTTTTTTTTDTMDFTSAETASTCQLTFLPIVTYTTGGSSSLTPFPAVGDFNADGHLDIVVSNDDSDNIEILLGIGNGTFKAQVTFSAVSCSSSVAVDDFDRDGYADLAISCSSTNIAVWFGNGDGTFRKPMLFLTGNIISSESIAIGDYNNDGYSDLAVANSSPSYGIAVLWGSINGMFGTYTQFCTNICSSLTSLATGDFNKDGQLDIVVSSQYTGSVYILLNNDNGYFDTVTNYNFGQITNPTSTAVGDFNNDNRLDLVVTNSLKNNIGIMLGDGNGDFGAQVIFSTGVYSYPYSIVVGDFNSDDQLDLAVSNCYAHNIGILIGVGDGTFLPQITFSTGAGSVPSMITAGDFNNDGKLDLVITDYWLNNVGILLNTYDCTISNLTTESVTTH